MPLVVVEGQVMYRRPKKEELPVIGRLYCNNEIRIRKERERHVRELSDSMSLLQKVLLRKHKPLDEFTWDFEFSLTKEKNNE